jgi:hypothetical protein
MCQTLRVLFHVRDAGVGIPLSYRQFKTLTVEVSLFFYVENIWQGLVLCSHSPFSTQGSDWPTDCARGLLAGIRDLSLPEADWPQHHQPRAGSLHPPRGLLLPLFPLFHIFSLSLSLSFFFFFFFFWFLLSLSRQVHWASKLVASDASEDTIAEAIISKLGPIKVTIFRPLGSIPWT